MASPVLRSGIVVVGGIVQDLISYVERFPRRGETILAKSFTQGAGGKGANQAVAAGLLEAQVAMIAMVGTDAFGDFNVDTLEKAGVDTAPVYRIEGRGTGSATISVTDQGKFSDNSIIMNLSANLDLTPRHVAEWEELIKSSAVVLCQSEIPQAAAWEAFRLARKHKATTFFNAAPADANLDKEMLQLVDILCTNESETELLTGLPCVDVHSACAASQAMLAMGVNIAIVTLGPLGCVLATKGRVTHVTTNQVEVIDTTGAGDAFCGTLAAILSSHPSWVDDFGHLEKAVRAACALATLSTTRKGTQTSYFSRVELAASGREALLGDVFVDIINDA